MEFEVIEVIGVILVLTSGLFLVSVFAPSGRQPVRGSKPEGCRSVKDGRGVAQWRQFT